jgi:hypothetical protein
MMASGSAASAVVAGVLIGQPVIDLVGDVPEAEPAAFRRHGGDGVGRHHHTGRIGGAHRQHTGERSLRMRPGDQLRRQREAGLGSDLDRDRLQPQRDQDVAIGRIARRSDGDTRARLETGQERQDEAARGAGRHHDALRRHADAISIAIMARDAFPQRIRTERLGISDATMLQRAACRRADRGRRRGGRLPDLHMHHRTAIPLDGGGLVHHIHDDEGRNTFGPRGERGHEEAGRSWLGHAGCRNRAALIPQPLSQL